MNQVQEGVVANRINFTKKALEKLPSPEKGGRDTYYDEKTSGLALRVTSTGTKTFMVYRRVQGRAERVTLGRFPSMTVEQARNKTTAPCVCVLISMETG